MKEAARQIGIPLVLLAAGTVGWFVWQGQTKESPTVELMKGAGCAKEDIDLARTGDPFGASADELLKEQDSVDQAIFSLRDAGTPEAVKSATLSLIPFAVNGHKDAAVELTRVYDAAAKSGQEAAKGMALRWRCQAYRLGAVTF